MEKIKDTVSLQKRNYYNHKDAGKGFLWAVISPYLISFVALLIVFAVATSTGMDTIAVAESLGFTIASAILTPLSFLSVFLIYNKVSKISLKACKLKFKINWKEVLILILISFVCVFGLQYFINGIDIGLEAIGYKLSSLTLPLDNGWWYLLNVVVIALLPAICEELIFRGIIFNGLRRNLKDGWAVVLSALLFALMHGSLEQFVYPFILGMILNVVVLRTGNLLSSIIVHFMNNFLVITIAFIQNMTGFSFMPNQAWLFWLLAFLLILVVFAILFIIDKFFFKHKSKLETEKAVENSQEEGRVPSMFLVIGIVIGVILFIVNISTSF